MREGVTLTYWARRNRVHHVSNDERAAAPLWDEVLRPELFALADELVRADALLDDPAFFVALTPFLDSTIGQVVDSDDGHSASQPGYRGRGEVGRWLFRLRFRARSGSQSNPGCGSPTHGLSDIVRRQACAVR